MSAETFYEAPKVLDTLVSFDNDASTGNLIIERAQYIPDDWISELRKQREASMGQREGDMMPVASIPVEVVDHLKRVYGYDVMTEPFKKTLAMLKQHGLDAFILTNKSL